MNLLREIQRRFASALAGLADDPADLLAQVRRSQDPKFGDYQANCAMPLGKRLGKPPREIAAEIIERLEISDLCQPPEIAGPGFINLRLRDRLLAQQAAAASADDRVGVPRSQAANTHRRLQRPQRRQADARRPHPQHGNRRLPVSHAEFLGHKAIGDNHLGDWGTQFGMIIFGLQIPDLREIFDIGGQLEKTMRIRGELLCRSRQQASG